LDLEANLYVKVPSLFI